MIAKIYLEFAINVSTDLFQAAILIDFKLLKSWNQLSFHTCLIHFPKNHFLHKFYAADITSMIFETFLWIQLFFVHIASYSRFSPFITILGEIPVTTFFTLYTTHEREVFFDCPWERWRLLNLSETVTLEEIQRNSCGCNFLLNCLLSFKLS